MIKKFEYRYPDNYSTLSFYEYKGVFKKYGDCYLFGYLAPDAPRSICIDRFNNIGGLISHNRFKVSNNYIPSMWMPYKSDDLMIVGKKQVINFKTMELFYEEDYSESLYNERLYSLSHNHYVFDDVIINHPTASIYKCVDSSTGQTLWRQSLKGYLYHEILLIDDFFVICTAEHGGGVYLIDKLSGRIRSYIDTKGTSTISIIGDSIYTYIIGKKGKIIKASLSSGTILSYGDLNLAGIECPLLVEDGDILTLSFAYNSKTKGYVPVVSCFNERG